MKHLARLLAPALLAPALLAPQETGGGAEAPAKKKSENVVTRFFQEEAERLTKELEGSWTLIDYADPLATETNSAPSGFATFHEGFLTWVLAIDSFSESFFGIEPLLVFEAGSYRYRVDEQSNLQLASVLSYTNSTANGELAREPGRSAIEYLATIAEGVLELRDPDGMTLSFRKVNAGDFPDAAIRAIEQRRSGTDAWEIFEEPPR